MLHTFNIFCSLFCISILHFPFHFLQSSLYVDFSMYFNEKEKKKPWSFLACWNLKIISGFPFLYKLETVDYRLHCALHALSIIQATNIIHLIFNSRRISHFIPLSLLSYIIMILLYQFSWAFSILSLLFDNKIQDMWNCGM